MITSLRDMKNLKKLNISYVSLFRNRFTRFSGNNLKFKPDLIKVLEPPQLEEVDLRGNPGASNAKLLQQLRTQFPRVTMLTDIDTAPVRPVEASPLQESEAEIIRLHRLVETLQREKAELLHRCQELEADNAALQRAVYAQTATSGMDA